MSHRTSWITTSATQAENQMWVPIISERPEPAGSNLKLRTQLSFTVRLISGKPGNLTDLPPFGPCRKVLGCSGNNVRTTRGHSLTSYWPDRVFGRGGLIPVLKEPPTSVRVEPVTTEAKAGQNTSYWTIGMLRRICHCPPYSRLTLTSKSDLDPSLKMNELVTENATNKESSSLTVDSSDFLINKKRL